MSFINEATEKLESLEPSSAASIHLSVESYLDVIRAITENFAPNKNLDVIYVTSSIPSDSILQVMKVLELDLDSIHFVDCISHIMMGATMRDDKVIYVESPTMLENIMIKVEYLIRKFPDKKKVVIIDSVSTLSIHNDPKILSEFFHILVNNLRSREAYTLIFHTDEVENKEISNMMSLVCDHIIRILPEKEVEQ